MALVPNRSAAMMRRVTVWSLTADVVVSLVIGFVIASVLGWIVFFIGLILTGLFYLNYSRVRRVRGMR